MGYRIKDIREKMRMSQEELAEKSGVSRTTISNLENDTERTVMISTLKKLADALGVSLGQIFLE